jgi:light-regulated signal transduction histidine kinase (bacteriophytochrome)
MSVSIVRDGALWRLVACHHTAPKFVSYEDQLAKVSQHRLVEQSNGMLQKDKGGGPANCSERSSYA